MRIVADGFLPFEALDFLGTKGLRPSFDHADVYGAEHAQAFSVAKAMSEDVLTNIKGALERTLREGQTYRQFQQELTPILQKLGWWGRKEVVDPLTGEVVEAQLGSPRRLELIFDANMRSARAAGQWERIERTQRLRPYLVYELGPSEHHRVLHASWAGTILPIDDPWWTTHFPPNGWRCKCWTRQVSRREFERLGGIKRPPPVELVKYVNQRTGDELQVPKGIDPGWEFNAGKIRTMQAAR